MPFFNKKLEMYRLSIIYGQFMTSEKRITLFFFLSSCACVSVNTFLNNQVAKLRGSVSSLFEQAACQRPAWLHLCLCALPGPDTILLWQNGKHLQRAQPASYF